MFYVIVKQTKFNLTKKAINLILYILNFVIYRLCKYFNFKSFATQRNLIKEKINN